MWLLRRKLLFKYRASRSDYNLPLIALGHILYEYIKGNDCSYTDFSNLKLKSLTMISGRLDHEYWKRSASSSISMFRKRIGIFYYDKRLHRRWMYKMTKVLFVYKVWMQ